MMLRLFRSSISDARLLGIGGPVLVVLVSGSVVIIRAFSSRTDPWLLGDWLIDYSAGFSRRGLFGEAIRQISLLFGVDRVVVTSAIIWLVFFQVVAVVAVLFLNHHRGLTTILLLVSPAFLFFFLNFLGTMRKELLLFSLVGSVLLLTRNPSHTRWSWLLPGLFPLLVFAHEGLALYGGFILIIIFLLHSEGAIPKKTAITQGLFTTAATGVAGWVILRWGSSPGIDQRICDNLVSEGYSKQLCGGAISFLDRNTQEAIERVAGVVANENYLAIYITLAALAAIPFLFVRFSRTLRVGLLVALTLTVPLYVVAIDWGRWLVITVWLVTFITVRFDGSAHVRVKPINPATFRTDLLAVAAILAYATLWSVPHCCEPRVGFGLIDRAAELLRYVGGG